MNCKRYPRTADSDPIGFRTCRFCAQLKPLEEMVAHKEAAQGRDTKCKACQKAYLSLYCAENKNSTNEKLKARKAIDPQFKMVTGTRSNLRTGIMRSQNGLIKRMTGININQLKIWFETQFKDGLSWENKNEWSVDHYIPLSYFDLLDKEQFQIANHWKNLRPIGLNENRQKWDAIPADAESLIAEIKVLIDQNAPFGVAINPDWQF